MKTNAMRLLCIVEAAGGTIFGIFSLRSISLYPCCICPLMLGLCNVIMSMIISTKTRFYQRDINFRLSLIGKILWYLASQKHITKNENWNIRYENIQIVFPSFDHYMHCHWKFIYFCCDLGGWKRIMISIQWIYILNINPIVLRFSFHLFLLSCIIGSASLWSFFFLFENFKSK